MKFKIGDRVYLREDSEFADPRDRANPIGVAGTILRGIEDNWCLVEWDNYTNNTYPAFGSRDLKHARVANTSIARKMYPDAKEDGKWLILR